MTSHESAYYLLHLLVPLNINGLNSHIFELYAEKAVQAIQSVGTSPPTRLCVLLFLETILLTRPRDMLPFAESLRGRIRELMAYTPLQPSPLLPLLPDPGPPSTALATATTSSQSPQGSLRSLAASRPGSASSPAGSTTGSRGAKALQSLVFATPHEIMSRVYVTLAFVASSPQLQDTAYVRKRTSAWITYLEPDINGQTQADPLFLRLDGTRALLIQLAAIRAAGVLQGTEAATTVLDEVYPLMAHADARVRKAALQAVVDLCSFVSLENAALPMWLTLPALGDPDAEVRR